jgi:hypothetical protein
MIKELDLVVLKKPISEQGLKAGDVGTVVFVHKEAEAFEVEFLTLHGRRGDSNPGSFTSSSGLKTGNYSRSSTPRLEVMFSQHHGLEGKWKQWTP